MFRVIFYGLILVGLNCFLVFSLHAESNNLTLISKTSSEKPRIDILAIHSYHQSFPWTIEQYSVFKSTLENTLPDYQLSFSTEYLNTKHLVPDEEFKSVFTQYLNKKYLQFVPDLIYITDDDAANLILKNPPTFLKNIPVVFSGVNNPYFLDELEYHNVTGVFESLNLQQTMSLFSQLLPNIQQVIYLGDNSITDNLIGSTIRLYNNANNPINIIHIQHESFQALLTKIDSLPAFPIILGSLGNLKDSQKKLIDRKEVISILQRLNRPILNNNINFPGVLGGFYPIIPFGQLAAEQAINIIKGQAANSITPITQPEKKLILYWDKIKQFELKLSDDLIQQSTILNKPKSSKENTLLLTISLISGLIVLIALLVSALLIKQRNKIINQQLKDALTGCYNRLKLINDLKSHKSSFLILIDISDFSSLNSFYGNPIGDRILQETAYILRNHLIANSKLYRASGDIFAILTPENMQIKQVTLFAESVIQKLEQFVFLNSDLNISISVVAGISTNTNNQRINEATTALANAKQARLSWLVYQHNSYLQEKQNHNAIWSRKLKTALANNKIVTFYQPIVDNNNGNIVSYEALVRLIDTDGSIISPYHFLEIAKKNRQYPQITKIVLENSLALVLEKRVSVSINLTLEDIYNNDTQQFLIRRLQESQLGQFISFEITENEGIDNHEKIDEFTQTIKSFGCKLSIDDFGTGYANFSHLIDLNADHLKIDGSIIKRLLTDKTTELVVTTIVEYAKGVGMKTIAEFVDSSALLDKVTSIGIDYSQGYYLGKPEAQVLACKQLYLNEFLKKL